MNVVEPFERQALSEPGRTALIVGDSPVTYGELLSSVQKLSTVLSVRGIGMGTRVGLGVNSQAGNIALSLALARMGAVSVALGPNPEKTANDNLLDRLGVEYVVHNRPAGWPPELVAGRGQFRLEELFAADVATRPGPIAAVEPLALWRIVLSSGTTGQSKGIALAHQGSLYAAQLLRVVFPGSPDERILVGLDVNTAFATPYWLRCLHTGACVVLPLSNQAEDAMQLVHRHRVTQMVTTTGMGLALAMLFDGKNAHSDSRPESLSVLIAGGSSMSAQVRQKLEQHVCVNVQNNVGASETALTAMDDAATRKRRPGCAGRLLPWVEAQAVGDDGSVLGVGEVGALRFRSPALALGYVGAAPEDDRRFNDGWYQSSDLGSVTEDGVLYLSGRASDVINILGMKIDPQRLENHVATDTGVVDCCAIEIPGDYGQPMLALAIVAPDSVEVEALRKRCAELGAAFVPRLVLRVARVHRNQGGKIIREQMRSEIIELIGRQAALQRGPLPTTH